MRKIIIIGMMILTLLGTASCGNTKNEKQETTKTTNNDNNEGRTSKEIVEELAVYYGNYTDEADEKVSSLLGELKNVDADAANKWEEIMQLWKTSNSELKLNYNELPDGLEDTEHLCIVVLGFQLNPDGSMKEELIERLKVALNSAKKYPKAYIVCTGGGTASENESATEAGKMGEWLVENGISQDRVIVEDKSLTTAQNAIYTYEILSEKYPEVSQIAIVSSDYHIATGNLLFGAQAILRDEKYEIVSNAAYKAPTGTLSTMFQAGALIELSGDVETAFEIYYDEYDIHELPTLK